MGVTWRDGAAAVLATLVVAVMLALTQAWSWPLLGDYRAGVVALVPPAPGRSRCRAARQV